MTMGVAVAPDVAPAGARQGAPSAGQRRRSRRMRGTLALAALLGVVGGCSRGPSAPAPAKPSQKPTKVVPGPSGIVAMTAPDPTQVGWVLAGTPTVKTLTQLNVKTGVVSKIVGVSSAGSALSQTLQGTLVLGLRTATAGAVELYDPTSSALLKSAPVAAPVFNVAVSPTTGRIFVLQGNDQNRSVAILDPGTLATSTSFPVDNRAVAVEPVSADTGALVLLANGTVEVLSTATGKITTQFTTGPSGRAMALSPDGLTLYVLRRVTNLHVIPSEGANVALVDLVKEQVRRVLPAPAYCVDIELSRNGLLLYDAVGTSTYGNVQTYLVSG